MASGVEVGRAYVTVLPNATGFASTLQSQVSSQVAPVGTSAGKDISTKLGDALKSGAMVVGGAAAATLGVALTKGWQRLTAIDTAKQKLLGLKMPAETVDQVMKNALNSVKGTAYGLGDAATVAASAVASGVKPGQDLERTLKLVADAAFIGGSSMGEMGAIFNKVAATGKVQGEVIQQLGERGVPIIQLLAKELGVSTEKVMEMSREGSISFDDFRNAMESGMGGAALKSGQTFQGAMDNVMASLGRMGANLLSGFFPQIKGGLNDLLGNMQTFEPVFTQIGKAAADGLKMILENIGPISTAAAWLAGILGTVLLPVLISAGVQGAIAWAKSTAAAITGAASQYAAHVKTVAGWVLSGAAAIKSGAETVAIWVMLKAEAIKSTAIQIAQLARQAAAWVASKAVMLAQAAATGAVTAAQWLLNAAMNANPIGLIILAVVALVGAFIYLWNTNEGFRNFFIGAWNAIVAAVQQVVTWFQSNVLPVLQAVWDGILAGVQFLVNAVITYFRFYYDVTMAIWNAVASFLTAAWSAISGAAMAAWNAIVAFLTGAWAKISTTVSNAASAVVSFLGKAWSTVTSAVSSAWNSVVSTISGAVSKFTTAVNDGIAKVVGWFSSLWSKIKSAIGDIGGRLLSVGRDMVEGIWQGISNGYSWITGKIRAWVGDVVAFFKRVFGIGSPSKLMRNEVGRWVGEGAIEGVYDTLGSAERAADALAEALTPSLAPVVGSVGLTGTGASVAGSGAASVSYGDVTVEISLDDLEQFRTLAAFLGDIDRKVQQGVTSN